jgi:hypothetical protein
MHKTLAASFLLVLIAPFVSAQSSGSCIERLAFPNGRNNDAFHGYGRAMSDEEAARLCQGGVTADCIERLAFPNGRNNDAFHGYGRRMSDAEAANRFRGK